MDPRLVVRERYRRGQSKPSAEHHVFGLHYPGEPDIPFTYPEFDTFGSFEVLKSVGHRGPPFKEGGPFSVRKGSIKRSSRNFSISQKADWKGWPQSTTFSGNMFGRLVPSDPIPLTFSDEYLKGLYNDSLYYLPEEDFTSYGATAIKRMNPLKPGASLGVAGIETYLDGLPNKPAVLFKRLKSLNSLGKEYLNVQFGWRPLLKDIQDMYHTCINIDNRLKQIIRDNNRPIRRKVTLRNDVSTLNLPIRYPGPGYPLDQMSGITPKAVDQSSYQPTKTRRTSDKMWAVGSFRYHIPNTDSVVWTAKAVATLFGVNPTPSLIYNVLPWSWLIDWFTNIGDVLDNLSAQGIANLIVDYSYVMRHRSMTDTYNFPGQAYSFDYFGGFSPQPVSFNTGDTHTVVSYDVKERIAASPFGFGLQLDDLSVSQVAILGALGLSRFNLGRSQLW